MVADSAVEHTEAVHGLVGDSRAVVISMATGTNLAAIARHR
jgi:hypothetical protein